MSYLGFSSLSFCGAILDIVKLLLEPIALILYLLLLVLLTILVVVFCILWFPCVLLVALVLSAKEESEEQRENI